MERLEHEARKATIRDVASLAGVSIKTVSRVVNNLPHVREDTRVRVQAAIEQLDFTPNAVARRLGAMRKKTVSETAPPITEADKDSANWRGGDIDWW